MSFRSNEQHLLFSLVNPDLDFRVLRLKGHEGLSETYEFELELACEDEGINFEDVVGQSCAITILAPNHEVTEQGYEETDDYERFIHGIINHFEVGAKGDRFTSYYITVVPKVWALNHRHNCRIFQYNNVIEIVTTLLSELGLDSEEYRFDCSASYQPYTYCVQYRESEFDFVSRLLEAEGIFYYFEHFDDKHVLVFADDSSTLRAIEDDDEIPVYNDAQGKVRNQHIIEFRYRESLTPGKVTLKDHDFTNPRLKLQSEKQQERFKDREVFDYPGWFTDKGRGDTLSRLRLEAAAAQGKTASGHSNVNRFAPGLTFKLANKTMENFDDEFVITRVEHISAQSGPLEEGATSEGSHYNNQFSAIPAQLPYRPRQKTRIPVVEGVQTATVVGPTGEEIYTDEHGRVKVQFHWDRYGKSDSESSCWVRVSQIWAGSGYGGMFIPRIGQEVIVDFLEGNPDKPIIIGRVYDGVNRPPYDLPAEKTKSTIKTNSSPGGKGFNEIRFEDRKGQEQLFIHAEKNQDIRVKNSHYESVGNEHHLSVGKNRFEFIKEDDHKIVEGDALVKIEGNVSKMYNADVMQHTKGAENYKVDGEHIMHINGSDNLKVAQNINLESGRSYNLKVGQNTELNSTININLTAGQSINLKAGGSFISITPGGINISGPMVKINSGGSAKTAKPAKPSHVAKPQEAEPSFAAATAKAGKVERTQNRAKPRKPDTYGPQAQALRRAAQNGTPFCAQCEK